MNSIARHTVRTVLQRGLFTLALVLASGSIFAAGKTTGDIQLPIQARPDMPAGIVWSPALLNSATLTLAAKNLPNHALPNTNAWVGVNFSRHHIISQAYLQALVDISQAKDADIPDADTNKQKLTAALNKIRLPGGAALLTTVVWAPVNLFEGPTGFLRADDPESGFEGNKPASFDWNRWNALMGVIAALNNVDARNSGDTILVSAKKLNAQGGLGKLADAVSVLAEYADQNHPTVQAFLNTDWVDTTNAGTLDLQNLVGYYNNDIVTNAPLQSKKSAYRLKLKTDR
jgi:hypothetical protein